MGPFRRLLSFLRRSPSVVDGEKLAQLLERVPGYRVLRELPTVDTVEHLGQQSPGQRVAAVIDTETTGLDPAVDRLVEIAIERFSYDTQGHIIAIERPHSWLEDPGKPMPDRLARLTGLTDGDLSGEKFDDAAIVSMLEGADLIIAHNAAFDRPFLDRRFPGLSKRAWACSLAQLDWSALGFDGRALGHLLLQNGWYFRGHRADKDVHALVTLLGVTLPDGRTILSHLLERCEQPSFRVEAVGAPFEAKDALKARGYRWDPRQRHWWREVDDSALDAETAWLGHAVYRSGGRPIIHRITAEDRFAASE